jgi:hypothetical protein
MYHNCSANTRETCANAANYEKRCFMSEWQLIAVAAEAIVGVRALPARITLSKCSPRFSLRFVSAKSAQSFGKPI